MINEMLNAQAPARMVAGALAHLARHMETGCPRAAYLAAMLLDKIANDPDADGHLRTHARELVAILDRDGDHEPLPASTTWHQPASLKLPGIAMPMA